MIKVTVGGVLALILAGCGAQGEPVAPGQTQDQTGAVADVGLAVGPNGVTPGVTVSEGIGRVTLGPGGLRLGAAGIPLSLGL